MFVLYKKSLSFIFAVSGLLVFFIVGGAVDFAKAAPAQLAVGKPISLKFHDIWPSTHEFGKETQQYFIKLVEERSKGQVKFEYYPGDQLLKNPDMLRGIQAKIVDIGYVITTYNPKELALSSALALPLLFSGGDYDTYYRAAWSLYKRMAVIQNEWSKFNQKVLYTTTPGFYHVFSKVPITRLEDFKGKKMKGAGGYSNLFLEELGATSLGVSNTETYTALQRGTIDGLIMNITSYGGFRLYEISKYATVSGITTATGSLSINTEVWNSLPQNIKDIMVKAGEDTMAHAALVEGRLDKSILERLEKENGVKVQTLPPEEIERWKAKVRPLLDKWVKEQGKDGQAVLDFIMKETKAK